MWKKKNDSFRKSLNRRVTPPLTAKAHLFQLQKQNILFKCKRKTPFSNCKSNTIFPLKCKSNTIFLSNCKSKTIFFNIKTKTFIPSNCKIKIFFLIAKANYPAKLQKHLALKAKWFSRSAAPHSHTTHW